MPISAISKSKLIIISCLVGLLQGCTTRTVTDEWVNSAIKEEDGFRLVVGREWSRMTSGADWEKKKILKEQGEYYKVPLDFSKPEIHLDPILIKENFSKTMYHPVKNSLLPYKIEVENPNDHSNGKNRELYSAPNPDADSLIGWHEEGRYGYAYYNSSKNIVQVLYTGETCTFPEKTRLHYLDYALSNDGRSVALYERDEANTLWGVRIFRDCKEIFTKEIENKKIDANLFYDFDTQEENIWILVKNRESLKILKSNLELNYLVPEKELESNSYDDYDLPVHKPIFDAKDKKLYWFSTGKSGPEDNPNLQVVLTEYDLVTKTKRSVLLKLGGPLH